MEDTLLIAVFAGYAAAFLLYLLPWSGTGKGAFVVFGLASVANLALSVQRGLSAGHLPFSNMYETMITLAACLFPLTLLSARAWKTKPSWIDPFLAAVIIFPSAFHIGRTFTAEIRQLPPALQSPFFFPHVVSYLVAYAACARAFLLSLVAVFSKDPERRKQTERAAYLNAAIGFPMLTVGLLLGCFWAKFAWGDYWSWDPKEVWALISWFAYLLYFHLRLVKKRDPRWSAFLLTLGILTILITLLVVNLTRIFGGLHAYA